LKARVSKIVGVIRRAVFSNGGGPPEREAREKEKQPAGGFRLCVVRLLNFFPKRQTKKKVQN
jgi:hypothetical protein